MTLKSMFLMFFLGFLVCLISPIALSAENDCEGYSSILYSNDSVALAICHGGGIKIDRKRLDSWQDCHDALILLRDKKRGMTTQYADCSPDGEKQFRVSGGVFMLRHFQTIYPGFELKPLLIESLDLTSNKKIYLFESSFPVCERGDVERLEHQINVIVAKPFNADAYYTTVYGAFYKLRDCAKSESKLVLSILYKYQNSGSFDGEIAEVLDSAVSEAELISAATNR